MTKPASYTQMMNDFRGGSQKASAVYLAPNTSRARNPLSVDRSYSQWRALQADLTRYYEECLASKTAQRFSGQRQKEYCAAVAWKRLESTGKYADYPGWGATSMAAKKRKRAGGKAAKVAPRVAAKRKKVSAAAPKRRRRRARTSTQTTEVKAMTKARRRKRKSRSSEAPKRRRRRARAAEGVAAAAPKRRRRRRKARAAAAAPRRRRRRARAAAAAPRRRTRKNPFYTTLSRRTVKRSSGKGGRRSGRGKFVAAKKYRKRASSRRRYSLENPLSGGEVFTTLLTGTLGYALADILDRYVATMTGPKGSDGKSLRTADQQAIAINGAPGWSRVLAQGALGVLPLVGAPYVRQPMARAALQGMGLGALFHLGGQLVKTMVLGKLLAGKDAKPDSWGYELYHDVTVMDDNATKLLEAEKASSSGTMSGLGALTYSNRPLVRPISPAIRAVTSGSGNGTPVVDRPGGALISATTIPSAPVMATTVAPTEYALPPGDRSPVMATTAPPGEFVAPSGATITSAPVSMASAFPMAPTTSAPEMAMPTPAGTSPVLMPSGRPGFQPCPTQQELSQMATVPGGPYPVSSMSAAQMQRMTYQNAINAGRGMDGSGCATNACLSGFPSSPPAGAFPSGD